jgi:hypothetical protein
MAEEIRQGTEDLVNIPDPALNHKRKMTADIAFVLQEQNIDDNNRRIWIKFRNAPSRFKSIIRSQEEDNKNNDIYHKKVALYISQPGKWAIIWMDDNFWKIERRKKLKPAERFTPMSMKIDARIINIEESRAQSIKRCISESSVL